LSIFSIIPVLLTALIAYSVYRYRNRLGYSVITISGEAPEGNKAITLAKTWGGLKAERLKIKSHGLRTLEAVELHFILPDEPVSLTLKEPTTLSKKSVKLEWQDKVLTITIPTLPPKEEIEIDIIRVGHYEPIDGRLKGTGGKYKIVRQDTYDIQRKIVDLFILLIFVIAPAFIGFWLDRQGAVQQPAPTSRPLAPTRTKG